MRVSIDRSQLAHALATVTRAIETRNSIPILANVLLAVEDGQLRLTGTDLDVEITTSLPVLDCHSGSATVPGKMLADIAKRVTGDITLELDAASSGGRLTVASGRSRYKLDVLPAEDFPSFSVGKFDTTLELDLVALVAPCVHAISTDKARQFLHGVFFSLARRQACCGRNRRPSACQELWRRGRYRVRRDPSFKACRDASERRHQA